MIYVKDDVMVLEEVVNELFKTSSRLCDKRKWIKVFKESDNITVFMCEKRCHVVIYSKPRPRKHDP